MPGSPKHRAAASPVAKPAAAGGGAKAAASAPAPPPPQRTPARERGRLFAPLLIPTQRRLQTLAVFMWTFLLPTLLTIDVALAVFTVELVGVVLVDIFSPAAAVQTLKLGGNPAATVPHNADSFWLASVLSYYESTLLGLSRDTAVGHYVHATLDIAHAPWLRVAMHLLAATWFAGAVCYGVHLYVDRHRSNGKGGRWPLVTRSRFFLRYFRGYFAAEVYVDVPGTYSRGGGSEELAFVRLDDPDYNDGRRFKKDGKNSSSAVPYAVQMQRAKRERALDKAERTFKSGRSYLVCCHPHGLFGFGVWCTWIALSDAMLRLVPLAWWRRRQAARAPTLPAKAAIARKHTATLTVHTMVANFRIPLWREFCLACGFVDVNRNTLLKALGGMCRRHSAWAEPKHGFTPRSPADRTARVAVLVPGGAAESVDCARPRLHLKKRYGFVKVALAANADLVPVYTFGETELYVPLTTNRTVMGVIQRLQHLIGVGTPLVCGRGMFNYVAGPLPRRRQLRTVIGQPIDTTAFLAERYPRTAAGHEEEEAGAAAATTAMVFTDGDVEALHAKYVAAVEALYRKYQPVFDPTGPDSVEIV